MLVHIHQVLGDETGITLLVKDLATVSVHEDLSSVLLEVEGFEILLGGDIGWELGENILELVVDR